MNDVDHLAGNIKHLTSNLSKLFALDARLKALDRLQTRLTELETFFLKYPELNIDEFKNAVVKVLEDPKLTNAQRVALLARNIEASRRRDALKTRRDEDLVKLGLMLLMIPEPTQISDLIGLSLIAAGVIHKSLRK